MRRPPPCRSPSRRRRCRCRRRRLPRAQRPVEARLQPAREYRAIANLTLFLVITRELSDNLGMVVTRRSQLLAITGVRMATCSLPKDLAYRQRLYAFRRLPPTEAAQMVVQGVTRSRVYHQS